MANVTTTAVLPPAVREYYDRLLLMTAYPQLIHTRFGQKRVLPEKMGDTIVFRRYAKLSTVPIPLVDGITPPGAPLSASDIKARVDFYGKELAVVKPFLIDLEAYVKQAA
jgi:N4-gp56 family major capsid protein